MTVTRESYTGVAASVVGVVIIILTSPIFRPSLCCARYCQVGNAVSVPVAQALGYAIGLAALRRSTPTDTIFGLPPQFPFGNGDGQAA